MDSPGADTRQAPRPATTAVTTDARARRASATASAATGSNNKSDSNPTTMTTEARAPKFDVSQHPAALSYQAAHPKRAIPRFGPYLLLQTLGEGEFGKVKLGLHATWGEEVAVKLIRRGNVENALRMSKVEREIEVLRTINHPNIVRLYDVIETDKYIGIVLEYASGGELFDHILAHRFLRERDACKLFAQLISGVSYIHQKKIVHRDLKLENLLLDRNRNVIITDFGFANRFEHRPDDLMQTSCGSPCYAAPELVISEGEYVGSAVDIWSCGVILYAMLAGYLPFDDDPANPDGDNINLLYKYIVTTPLTFPDHVSQGARDLLARMLVPDPKHRADLATIMAHPWLAPYSAQFQLSVDQLEQQATEQQHAKRMAYQRQFRKKQAQQALAAQAQPKAHRVQSSRPAAATDDPSDLLYTSAASPSRRDRVGASAIVLPSPVAAPVDTELLTVDGQSGPDASGGERKSRGYRHTIQLEYDTGTRENGTVPPVPVPPILTDVPAADAAATKSAVANESPSVATTDTTPTAPKPPTPRRSSSNVRTASASRVAPPSAFAMPASPPNNTRSVSASAAEVSARAASSDSFNRSGSVDMNVRSPDYSMSGDEMPSTRAPSVTVPAVRVSVPPPTSPTQETDVFAALNDGRAGSLKNGVPGTGARTNGVNNASDHGHGPGLAIDDLSQTSVLGGDQVRSPVLVTPTSTGSAGLPTPVAVEPPSSEITRPAASRSASGQIKSTNAETGQLPSSIGPVRNISTTSSTGASRSKSSRHSTKPAEKPADDEAVGNTSVSSSKSRRKTLSLMVEPFQRPFRTRTPVDATPAHATGQITTPERKDTQPLRSAPPSSFAPSTAPPSTIAPSTVAPPSIPAPTPAYKTNTERFMTEGSPIGPASATSKAKRVMNWFRKRSLASSEVPGPAPAPVPTIPARPPLASPPVESGTPLTDSAVPTPRIGSKNSGGLDSLSTASGPKQPVSIVKPTKPVVNRAGMRVHEGAVDQAMVTSGSPLDALAHAEAVLAELGITFQKESEFKFRCLRPKKRKGVSGSVGPLGGMSAGHVGSAASNGIDRRGLPLPPPPSFSGAGGMLRGLLRRSSAQPGLAPEPETSSLPEPIYGERNDDAQDEVRFFVELTRIDRLEDTYSIDVRRLKGNLRSYKFVYDTMRESEPAAPEQEKNFAATMSSTTRPTRKPLPGYYQFGAGAFAGVTEICIFYPLDVVKTRMQLDTGKSPSLVASFRNIIREEGVGRLYRGLVPPLLLEAPKRAVKFASNDYWGKTFLGMSGEAKMSQGLSIATGCAAGATESFVVVPFELVKIRLQDKTSKYAGPMDVVRTIIRQHGLLGLYAGMESTFWRHVWWKLAHPRFCDTSGATPLVSPATARSDGGFFGTIHTLREHLPKAETPQAALLNNFISGAAGGFVGTALNTPFDVVKSRIQGAHPLPGVVPKYNWTYPSLALILREEGPAALYKGFVPKVLRLAPGGGVLLLVVEAVLGVVRKAMQSEPTLSFDVLPPEVVEHIAVDACSTPFLGPPVALPGLLVLNRRTYAALSLQTNPGFLARVFRAKFDSLAPARRFRAAGQPLTAVCYALELRRRFVALRRIRHVASTNRFDVCSEEDERADFWLLYLMFLESDGKNFDQMMRWAQVTSYLRVYLRDQLMPHSRPGFPLESTMRSLGLWLMWFLTEVHAVVAEMASDLVQVQSMLRPWVFASFKYDALFAPYTYYHLPAPPVPAIPPTPLDDDPLLLTPQYLADLDLRDRTEIVTHMARRIRLAPPPASIAAIMAFMVRLERNGPIPSRPPQQLPPQPGPFPSTVSPTHPGLTIYPRTRYPSWRGPGSLEFDGRPNMGSTQWDSEWLRLVSCGNPQATIPPHIREQPKFRPGDLAGVWEGRFVVSTNASGLQQLLTGLQFITFDAFRDMLAGAINAVQSGPLAQQPQVWRIREHHCIDRRRRVPSGFDSRDVIRSEMLPVGNPLDAYIPANAEFVQHGEPLPSGAPISATSNRRLEVRVPDANAPGGYSVYSYVTRDGSSEPTDVSGPVPIPTHYMEMYAEPDAALSPFTYQEHGGDDEWVETITDTLITGEGHSNWGEFHLRGRIRHWDGMITVVKDYAGPNTQGRGRWLYKGYIVAGANWVGRWRDTFTAERLSGYEGVFSVTRRV
ncbi:hypothetical protein FRC06_006918 [Ceratobasidium sp. 370]|nr:hypothetical protein FRC06_006918 [Ceratobasidium sp. 370]